MKRWTVREVEKHLRENNGSTYSMAVVSSALFKRLYGRLPKIGLSGFQGNGARQLAKVFPNQKRR